MLYEPQYVDRNGRPITTAPASLWERILGYRPRYVTPSQDSGEASRSRARRASRRSANENE